MLEPLARATPDPSTAHASPTTTPIATGSNRPATDPVFTTPVPTRPMTGTAHLPEPGGADRGRGRPGPPAGWGSRDRRRGRPAARPRAAPWLDRSPRRRRWGRRLLVAAGLLALLALASNLGEADRRSDAGAAGLGDPVRDGQFEFVVGSVDCGARSVGEGFGRKQALEQFCLVRLEVENTGTEAGPSAAGTSTCSTATASATTPTWTPPCATAAAGCSPPTSTRASGSEDPRLRRPRPDRRGPGGAPRRPSAAEPASTGLRPADRRRADLPLAAGGDHGEGEGDRDQVLDRAQQGLGQAGAVGQQAAEAVAAEGADPGAGQAEGGAEGRGWPAS